MEPRKCQALREGARTACIKAHADEEIDCSTHIYQKLKGDLTASLGPLNYPKAYPKPLIMAELGIKDPNHYLIKEPVRLKGA